MLFVECRQLQLLLQGRTETARTDEETRETRETSESVRAMATLSDFYLYLLIPVLMRLPWMLNCVGVILSG